MKKSVKIGSVVLTAGLAMAFLMNLGNCGGIGPFSFLNTRKLRKHPGNVEEYHLEHIQPLPDSPIAGKRILFLGSSVTKGENSLDVSMADYIGVLDSCDIVKNAVSGTTLADINRRSYVSRLKKMNSDQHFDAVVVQLSTNDATQDIPLGALAAGKDPAKFDSKTVLGALETILAYVKDTWDCPVMIYTGVRYESDAYQAMVDAMPSLADKWGVTIADLWNDPDMNRISKEDYELYMFDSIHPTQAGYLWWTPKIEEGLKNMLSGSRWGGCT